MVLSRQRFAEIGKEMFRNKKKHVKGVKSFCYAVVLCKTNVADEARIRSGQF